MTTLKAYIHHVLQRIWYPRKKIKHSGHSWNIYTLGLYWSLWRRDRYARCFVPPSSVVWTVSNVTMGGTGKTPLVLMLAEYAHKRGISVGILSRGYGKKSPRKGSLKQLRVQANDQASHVGDEPLMLARLSGLPVYCVDDPVAFLSENHAAHALWIVDDCWSRLRVWAHCWWTIDAQRLLGNKKMLPWGPLRYPVSFMQSPILAYSSDETCEGFDVVLKGLRSMSGNGYYTPATWPYHVAVFITGIAHPDRVATFLRNSLSSQFRTIFFADHETWGNDVTQDIPCVVITQKDAARLAYTAENIYIIDVEYRAHPPLLQRIQHSLDTFL